MFKGSLPMLTKGPLALFFGGDLIIGDLSERSPGKGMPIVLLCSLIFQIFLVILKQAKSRKLKMYAHNLTRALVENVLNMYGIVAIIIITTVSVVYALLHLWSIEKNKNQDITTNLVPNEIFFLHLLIFIITIVPFIKSYALR